MPPPFTVQPERVSKLSRNVPCWKVGTNRLIAVHGDRCGVGGSTGIACPVEEGVVCIGSRYQSDYIIQVIWTSW